MSTGPADSQERWRSKLIDNSLPGIVDEVLDTPEIAIGVVEAGLDPNTLRQQAFHTWDELVAAAESEMEFAVRVWDYRGTAWRQAVR